MDIGRLGSLKSKLVDEEFTKFPMPTPTGLFPLSEDALLYLSDAQAQACEVSVLGGNTNKPV